MELLLGDSNNMQLVESNLLDLPKLLMMAQPPRERRQKRMRLAVETWQVSLVYMLGQLAYDTLCQMPFAFSVSEVTDKIRQLAESFATLACSSLLEASMDLFLLDLYLYKRGNVEGLTLEWVVDQVTRIG